MVYTKRLIISIILGMIAGLACAYLGKPALLEQCKPEEVSNIMCSTALNRTLIGLMIGISCWRMHWALHGIIIGFLGSLAISVPFGAFIILSVAGIVWGFLIELIVTVIFKAPMRTIEPAPAPSPAPAPAPTPPPPPAPPPPPSE